MLRQREAVLAVAAGVSVIYVLNNLEWPSKDVINIEMALDRNKVSVPDVDVVIGYRELACTDQQEDIS